MHFSSAAAALYGSATTALSAVTDTLVGRTTVPPRLTHEQTILAREIYSQDELDTAKALDQLIAESAAEGISQAVALENFEFQFGTTFDEQIDNITSDFNELSVAEICEQGYLKGFVSPQFINTRKRIQKQIDSEIVTNGFFCQSVMLKCIPRNIGELLHLKNLDLFASSITCLPSSIAQVNTLETIDIRNTPYMILNHTYIPENCKIVK